MPYKTNVGIQFRHEAGKDVHAPGLYFHVEPGQLFLGSGMWRPDRDALTAVRTAIVDDPKGWRRVRDARRFRDRWQLGGDSLKRAPRGYPDDHPLIEDLRRTDHIAFSEFPARMVTDPGMIDEVVAHFRASSGYLRLMALELVRELKLPQYHIVQGAFPNAVGCPVK